MVFHLSVESMYFTYSLLKGIIHVLLKSSYLTKVKE